MPQTAMTDDESELPMLFRHTVHPEWGAAALAWNTDDKYGFQFEDGRLRVFKSGFLHLLEEVDLPVRRASSIYARLRRKLGVDEATPSPAANTNAISFEDQLRVFAQLYPAGFDDPSWVSTHRRPEGGLKRLKRHRDRSISEAERSMATQPLRWAEVVELISETDLVSSQQRKALRGIHPRARDELAASLHELLRGEREDESYAIRFERFIGLLATAMRSEPTWQLATVIPALVFPHDHVCVRPTSFRAQAAWMAPRLMCPVAPTADVYERLRRMTLAVRDALRGAGHKPRDLLDVYDFMWATLRPTARAVLDAVRTNDASHPTAA